MKTHLGKIAIGSMLSLLFLAPQHGFSQYTDPAPQDGNQQYTNPPDTPPDTLNQQIDQDEVQQTAPPDTNPVNTQVFYNQLAPYGQWVNYGTYGYVWIPSAGPNFTPYSTEGHWVYTTYGWTWVSDYSWGWAPFHYGRWLYDEHYGWLWIPGVTWGPAWVAWRHCDGYYGWAPLYPGLDITVSYAWWANIPVNYWCFVNERFIGDRYVSRHFEPRNYNATYIRNTTIINNNYYDKDRHTSYASGPRREDVEKAIHMNIRPLPVRETARPEQRYDQAHLHLYRPNVVAPRADEHPAPQRSVEMKDVPQRAVKYDPQAPNNWREPAQRQAPQPQQRQQYQQPQQRQQQYQQPRQQPQQQRQQPQRQAPVQRQAPAQRGGNSGGYGGGNSGGGRRH